MIVAAIDPGPEQSAFVLWDGARIIRHAILTNMEMLEALRMPECPSLIAIEQIKSYGRAVGDEVFSTCVMIGRMYQICTDCSRRAILVPRMEVKMHLCYSPRAKDANIRQALIDRFGKPGNKTTPGVLFGVASHSWAALALAVTVYDRFNVAPTEIP